MAEGGGGSPIRFPSPSAILGKSVDTAPPPPPPPSSSSNRKKDTSHARRPSKDSGKKVAVARKDPASQSRDAGAVKPKQTKSRNGCPTCKAKRLKCGEERPFCHNCLNKKLVCPGYAKNYSFLTFEGPKAKMNARDVQRPSKGSSPPRQASAGSSKVTTPLDELPPLLATDPPPPQSRGRNPDCLCSEENDKRVLLQQPPSTLLSNSKEATKRDSASTLPCGQHQDPAPPPDGEEGYGEQESPSVSFDPAAVFTFRSRSLSEGHSFPGSTPTMTEFLVSSDHATGAPFSQDFVSFSMPEDMPIPLWPADAGDPGLPEGDNGNDNLRFEEYIAPTTGPFSPWSSCVNPLQSSPTSEDPNIGTLGLADTSSPVYMQANFVTDSEEYLSMTFDRETCGILSIMDGPTENPWRTIIWPMAQSSPALRHALLALTAYHMSQHHRAYKRIGHEHKDLSIQNIGAGIREGSMNDQTALATALALAFAESWDRQTESGHAHIKGAQAMVRKLLNDHRVNPRGGMELKGLKFLCNAWVYMDVIARLTCVDNDQSTDFDINYFSVPDAPETFTGNGRAKSDGFGINFGMPIDARLDPLMGCAGTLFPYIGRVGNLIRKVCRTLDNSPKTVSDARDLKTLLDDWEAPEQIDRPEDSSTKTQHAVQTAEAFRLATLLHLHSAVPELPSLSSADLARKVLGALATIPTSSRTVVVHMFPLLAAGCEVHEDEDRQWVHERWQAMGDRMHIGVVDKCLEVTQEVWRRRDLYESRAINNRRLVRTLELVAAAQNDSSHTVGGSSIDPSAIGVVYSWLDADCELRGITPLKDINGPEAARFKKDVADRVKVDLAYSVRGHLHWAGVCSAWDFQCELSRVM